MVPAILVLFLLGFLFSMLGLGGAMLYIPVFHWFGFDFKSVAIPTGLLLNGVTALSAAFYCSRKKMVDVKGGMPMVITSFIGAPIGAWFTHIISSDVLMALFSIGMMVSGSKMILSSGIAEPTELNALQTAGH